MLARTEWTCPGCQRKYAVPSTDGLTVCPTCAATIAAPRSVAPEMMETELPETDAPLGFPEFGKTEDTAARPTRRQFGPLGAAALVVSWILGMYLAWSGYLLLGKPQFIFRENAFRWTLEIHRDKVPPIVLPLWRHR